MEKRDDSVCARRQAWHRFALTVGEEDSEFRACFIFYFFLQPGAAAVATQGTLTEVSLIPFFVQFVFVCGGNSTSEGVLDGPPLLKKPNSPL